MTLRAERNQVSFGVVAGAAAKLFVMDSKFNITPQDSTPPAPLAIATQNLRRRVSQGTRS
jgi:hypothetical protein